MGDVQVVPSVRGSEALERGGLLSREDELQYSATGHIWTANGECNHADLCPSPEQHLPCFRLTHGSFPEQKHLHFTPQRGGQAWQRVGSRWEWVEVGRETVLRAEWLPGYLPPQLPASVLEQVPCSCKVSSSLPVSTRLLSREGVLTCFNPLQNVHWGRLGGQSWPHANWG